MRLPLIERGKRAIISGRTGSGKTTAAVWLLSRSPGRWIVLDTKRDELLGSIGEVVPMRSRYANDERYLIVRPDTFDPEEIDDWIYSLSERSRDIGLFIDELYYLHVNGRAGDGLVGWLTRGRSKGQSFIGCTQRPAWVSRFCFSEADYLAEFSLNLPEDRKRLYEFTGRESSFRKLRAHYWRWYDVQHDKQYVYAPVPLAGLRERFIRPVVDTAS